MSERDVTPGRMPRRITPKAIIIVVVVILALITAFSSFFVVDQKEIAVVLLFGRYNRMAEPGRPPAARKSARTWLRSRPGRSSPSRIARQPSAGFSSSILRR